LNSVSAKLSRQHPARNKPADDLYQTASRSDPARRSGFAGVIDLLKVAKHGAGENVYLIDFRYKAA
jgi:hypothetical protein